MIKIDVVVGGLYGKEGVGQAALWLADHEQYKAHVRTGSESDHQVVDRNGRSHTFSILPSASVSQK